MMADINMEWHDCHLPGTIVHVAVDGRYAGHIVINDQIKADSAEAVASLKRAGVERTVMLTGDREDTAKMWLRKWASTNIIPNFFRQTKWHTLSGCSTKACGKESSVCGRRHQRCAGA